jgi:uncharacterized protein (TIGR00255 family)
MIKSMTSFAHHSEQGNWGSAVWEIRCLNHRYFDCSFHLPESLRNLESELRESLRSQLTRGKIDCYLRYQPGEAVKLKLSLNTDLVKQLAVAANKLKAQFKNSLSSVDPMRVLLWHDVLQISETESELVRKKIIKLFEQTLAGVIIIRKREGSSLGKLIVQRLQNVLLEIGKIKKLLPLIIKSRKEKLLSHLEEVKVELDASRLEQEMVFFAQKIDVTEEIERMELHIQEIQRILKQGGVVGKGLDFLMQELNRDANTLASKSVDKRVTHAAVEIKILVEQMREQVQNIE